jgi:hypothetical protein
MTQPPGPDESTGPAQPSEPVPPADPGQRETAPPETYTPPAVPGGYAAGQGVPQYPAGGYDRSQPYPVQYDPSQPYVIYQAAPTGGLFHGGQIADGDPLISPDYSGWWRRTLAIVKHGWRWLALLQVIGFVISLLISVPQALLLVTMIDDLARASRTIDPDTGRAVAPDLGPLFAMFGLILAGAFLGLLVSFVVAIACNHVAVSVAAGLRPRLGAALGLAVRRVFPLLGWQVLAGLIVMVGICACILPAIYLSAVFAVLPAVVTFERGSAAIGRCFKLFHQDLGVSISRIATIGGISIGIAVVAYIINQIIQSVPGQPVFDTDSESPFGDVGTGYIVAVVIGAVVTDLFTRAGAVLTSPLTLAAYADLRARVEPLSTATLADEVGLAPAYPQQQPGGGFPEPLQPPPGQGPSGPDSDWMPPNR